MSPATIPAYAACVLAFGVIGCFALKQGLQRARDARKRARQKQVVRSALQVWRQRLTEVDDGEVPELPEAFRMPTLVHHVSPDRVVNWRDYT